MKRKRLVIIFCLLLSGLAFLIFRQWPDDKLHLVFCDVGQGDAIIVRHKFNQILIDGGPDEAILNCLSDQLPFWERKIELVVLTHPETDHYFGLIPVLERYKVEKFVGNGFAKKGDENFEKLLSLLLEQKITPFFPRQGDKIRLGLISFDIVWPSRAKEEELTRLTPLEKSAGGFSLVGEGLIDPNESSIAALLKFGDFSALLTSDLPGGVAQVLSWRKELPRSIILKASHHGSAADNPEELYQAVSPRLVVFSVGKNSFGHPSEVVLERLKAWGIETRRTDKDGEVEIVSDGSSWEEK